MSEQSDNPMAYIDKRWENIYEVLCRGENAVFDQMTNLFTLSVSIGHLNQESKSLDNRKGVFRWQIFTQKLAFLFSRRLPGMPAKETLVLCLTKNKLLRLPAITLKVVCNISMISSLKTICRMINCTDQRSWILSLILLKLLRD